MSRSSLRNALLMERVQLAKVQDAVGQGEVGLGSWKTSVGGSIPLPRPLGSLCTVVPIGQDPGGEFCLLRWPDVEGPSQKGEAVGQREAQYASHGGRSQIACRLRSSVGR